MVLGLVLASGTEESMVGRTGFLGFSAALLNNCLDCVSNVVSKKVLLNNLRCTFVSLPPLLPVYHPP